MFDRKNKEEKNITDKDMQLLCAEYESVYHYVLSICKNETDAEDITQETFLKAVRSQKQFNKNSSLYTWLCTISKNIWIDKCRKSGKIINDEIPENIPDNEKSVEQIISDKDNAMKIHQILHTLEEPYKEVFSLRIFGELGFKDIADIFGKTESWARVTFHRAKKKISEKL